jgi:hypothetical protein
MSGSQKERSESSGFGFYWLRAVRGETPHSSLSLVPRPAQKSRRRAFLDYSPQIAEIQRLRCGAEWIRTSSTVSELPDDVSPLWLSLRPAVVCLFQNRNREFESTSLRQAVPSAGFSPLNASGRATRGVCALERQAGFLEVTHERGTLRQRGQVVRVIAPPSRTDRVDPFANLAGQLTYLAQRQRCPGAIKGCRLD